MNLSVIIGTCDSYSELWETFQICFNKYWKHNTENIFITEEKFVKNYTETNFKTFKAGKNQWGKRIIEGVKSCKNEYILFLLEDYFLDYYYSSEDINNWIFDCKKHKINRLQISPSGHQIYKNVENMKYHQISEKSDYLISLQPSIWSKEFLLRTLIPYYSPWDFEILGSNMLKYHESNIFIDKSIPNVYFNAVRRGKRKSPGWKDFFQKESLKDFNI